MTLDQKLELAGIVVTGVAAILIGPGLAFAGWWLTHRSKVYEIKSQLLDNFTQSIWLVIISTIHLSIDAKRNKFDESVAERHKFAFQKYHEGIPDLYGRVRAQISKTSAYVTLDFFQDLQVFYEVELVKVDTRNRDLHDILINAEVPNTDKIRELNEHYVWTRKMKARTDSIINRLVRELRVNTVRQPLDPDAHRDWLKSQWRKADRKDTKLQRGTNQPVNPNG